MIKQPTQPLRFFSSYLEVERDWNERDKGNPGTHVITEDILFIPSFQIKFNNRHEDITDFQDGTIELINYEDGTVNDISQRIRAMGVHTYGDYQNFVVYHYPLTYLYPAGNYYLKIADGVPASTTSNEVWYSEVFKLCDLSRNLLNTVTFSGWHDSAKNDLISTRDIITVSVCEEAGNGAYFDMGSPFYVVENEPLDFYCFGVYTSLACTDTDFIPLHFALVDLAGNIISNTIDGIEGAITDRFIPTVTRPAQLRGWVDTETGHSQWQLHLLRANPQLYNGTCLSTLDKAEDIGIKKVLRWSNTCSICNMIYGIQEGYVRSGVYNYYWTMSYENYLILDDPPLIPDFAIVENVSEDDSSNKYLLLGNQQEWYYFQIAANDNLAKAIHFIHLMSAVEIDYDGEAHTICENNTEISAGDDNNFTTKFRFREVTCPVQSCCLEICCPNVMNAYQFQSPGLPACSADGLRYLSKVGGTNQLWQCDGVNWIHITAEEYDGACIYVEAYLGCKYWWWDSTEWVPFVTIIDVTDHGDQTADINIADGGKPGIYVQGQYSLDDGVTWVNCGGPYELTGVDDIVNCACGAGADIHFRLHVYSANSLTSTVIKCDYGYSHEEENIDIA